jgi:hypothetical protein
MPAEISKSYFRRTSKYRKNKLVFFSSFIVTVNNHTTKAFDAVILIISERIVKEISSYGRAP